jgi:hypothetical protein
VVSSRGGDDEVLTGCASQNMLLGGSDVQAGGLRDRASIAKSIDTARGVRVVLGRGEARTGRRRATSECVPRKR